MAPVKRVEEDDDDDDDDFELFGSDEEDEETTRLKEERLASYAAKKSTKPTIIAKSSIVLDVKPVRILPNWKHVAHMLVVALFSDKGKHFWKDLINTNQYNNIDTI